MNRDFPGTFFNLLIFLLMILSSGTLNAKAHTDYPPLASSTLSTPVSNPLEIGAAYDKTMRDYLQMPPHWFQCQKEEDCVIIHVPCNTGLAVNKKFRKEAILAVCHGPCTENCLNSSPDTSHTLCRFKSCHTVIEHYQIPHQ